jgi:hypothetical protein
LVLRSGWHSVPSSTQLDLCGAPRWGHNGSHSIAQRETLEVERPASGSRLTAKGLHQPCCRSRYALPSQRDSSSSPDDTRRDHVVAHRRIAHCWPLLSGWELKRLLIFVWFSLACHARGRGFEPRRSRHKTMHLSRPLGFAIWRGTLSARLPTKRWCDRKARRGPVTGDHKGRPLRACHRAPLPPRARTCTSSSELPS